MFCVCLFHKWKWILMVLIDIRSFFFDEYSLKINKYGFLYRFPFDILIYFIRDSFEWCLFERLLTACWLSFLFPLVTLGHCYVFLMQILNPASKASKEQIFYYFCNCNQSPEDFYVGIKFHFQKMVAIDNLKNHWESF